MALFSPLNTLLVRYSNCKAFGLYDQLSLDFTSWTNQQYPEIKNTKSKAVSLDKKRRF